LLTVHAHVVHAVAVRLRIERTINGEEVDAVIETSVAKKAIDDERQRHVDWQHVTESAKRFVGEHSIRVC
jgi:hypothetical protein